MLVFTLLSSSGLGSAL